MFRFLLIFSCLSAVIGNVVQIYGIENTSIKFTVSAKFRCLFLCFSRLRTKSYAYSIFFASDSGEILVGIFCGRDCESSICSVVPSHVLNCRGVCSSGSISSFGSTLRSPDWVLGRKFRPNNFRIELDLASNCSQKQH